MNTNIRQQLAEVKSKVLELTCALIHESEETFNREHAILDLIMLSEEIHNLEGLCMEATISREMVEIRSVADLKERMYKMPLNKGFHDVTTETMIRKIKG